MKTQIITLETHDDLISVRDRLSWAKTPRILLVAPKYINVNLRQVDLKVLQRHATSLGAQLGLVTRHRTLRGEAEAVGIPVFESTKDAQRVSWSLPVVRQFDKKALDKTLREQREQVRVREEAWRAHPIVRILFFVLGVSAVLALAALFLPRAQVRLDPIKNVQSVVVPVSSSASVRSVFITGSIPAYEQRIVVNGEQKVVVTGEGTEPQSKATGVVFFRNLTQEEVTIPVGTVVRSGEVRFVTTEEGVVDAGVGETIELPIEAVDGGAAGNIDAETINIVEGRLSPSLIVTNPDSTSGGRERSSVQATDSDRARAKELLLKSLEAEAHVDILDAIDSGSTVFDETFSLAQIISESYDLPSGATGTQLTLTMQAEYSVLYANASDLTELASLALNSSLPSNFVPGAGAIHIDAETEPSLADDGSIRWTIRVEREIVRLVNDVQVTQLVAGLSTMAAQSQLEENLPLASAPNVTLSPSWWPWVPIVPFRIEVVTQ